ncbi:diacylglycerol/lipid kinase family protein [Intrasporangium calvum]|uniref:Diacylglycerol kinase catalytic region n=1 Tax=Intrasporangium calvum (strain ATCC 23552 / DSM 43043 / JCM 3097 / NBRC 12989 / NCIMB 10167 / NRRL B-3866 / 7 KIP) TaxID=710696 RepID=E6SFA7_INTC7|nr:diacylglycerol kinase family protein [Intrasporangium calvum]ADU49921.1 diacylglycerol kinase catalytic region [Intrasporangium calvum DSM 43043]AXG14760.1 diacylglycerol kinase [Intrasporangium calvum]
MPESRRRVTVVYNPMKVDDLDADQGVVAEACRRHGWDEPQWIPTTAEETGEKQAREAVEAGADVVATLGGDGTVRAVATALVGTDVALGLLPGGTGNLLARNLDLPVDSIEDAMEPLLTGSDLRLDVGFVAADDDPEEVFLIMTGLGFDGEIMAGTNERVKGVLGWPAYLLSGLGNLFNRGFTVEVTASGAAGVVGQPGDRLRRHARTVIVGNCGTLQGGIELMPEAEYDDGVLDAVVIAPRGAFGWASVIADVSTRHRVGHQRLDRMRGRDFTIVANRPTETEIDGDPVGPRSRLDIRVEPSSLVVRHA